MRYLKIGDILAIHRRFETTYGIDGTVLQPSNLEAALEAPRRTLFGEVIYPSLTEKAAALMCVILKLHPFVDGNNRTGYTSAAVFLERNGRKLKENPEAVSICLETSKCNINVEELTEWIRRNSESISD